MEKHDELKKEILDSLCGICFIDCEQGSEYMCAPKNKILGMLDKYKSAIVDSAPLHVMGLLKVAKCPDCDGSGFYAIETGGCDMDGEKDTRECMQEQCRWCFERNSIMDEYEKA